MGRKNRNARPWNNHSTFEMAMKDSLNSMFDLNSPSAVCLQKEKSRVDSNVEIICTICDVAKKTKNHAFNVSIRRDLADTFGEYMTAKLITSGNEERLYFLPSDSVKGFKVTKSGGASRRYARFGLEDKHIPLFMPYVGNHELKRDPQNDVYFIVKGK